MNRVQPLNSDNHNSHINNNHGNNNTDRKIKEKNLSSFSIDSFLLDLKCRIQCFFEGGHSNCRHCGKNAWIRNKKKNNNNNFIDGLNSNLITPFHILAMARPVTISNNKNRNRNKNSNNSIVDALVRNNVKGELYHCV